MTCCSHHKKANKGKIQVNPFVRRCDQSDNNPENLHRKSSLAKKNNIGNSMIRFQGTGVPIQSALPLLTTKPQRSVPNLPLITMCGAITVYRRSDETSSCPLYCVTQNPVRCDSYYSPNCTVLIHRNLYSRTGAPDLPFHSQIPAQVPSLGRY